MIIIGGEVKPNLNTTTEQKMTIELIDLDTGDTIEVPKDKVNHPAAGLQFSGEPTERALRAQTFIPHYKDEVKLLTQNYEECRLLPTKCFIKRDLQLAEIALEALQLMAEERR